MAEEACLLEGDTGAIPERGKLILATDEREESALSPRQHIGLLCGAHRLAAAAGTSACAKPVHKRRSANNGSGKQARWGGGPGTQRTLAMGAIELH